MNPSPLTQRLGPLLRRQRRIRFWSGLALGWGAAAVVGVGFIVVRRETGWASPFTLPLLAVAAVAGSIWTARRLRRFQPELRELARRIEAANPALNGVLLTAVQQEAETGGQLSYLQTRVVQQALDQSGRGGWREAVPTWKLVSSHVAHGGALALFLAVLVALKVSTSEHPPALLAVSGLTVTPGDTSLERGSSLVVLARFGSGVPAAAELVINTSGQPERRLPLTRSLADPVFGGSVPEVGGDLTYRVEYGGRRSADFKVTVFEYPRLERSDADLTFPSYTSLPPKRIEDTRRVSAVEGSRVDFALQLNKPVASARLVVKTNAAASLSLDVGTNQAVALLRGFSLTNSASYELQLVDAEGRTNKLPATFVLDALKNRTPELKFVAPRGDVRPSALEEIPFAGTVWDDFGMPTYGLAYTSAGGETHFIELGKTVPGNEKRSFQHLLRLEELGVQPDDLLSWYVWADDIGPDGEVRRTQSDLFFAEVRPFEEIFREGQGTEGGESEGQQQGTPATKLAELQKQIINATWKLQRGKGGGTYPADAGVVRDSQSEAIDKAKSEMEKAADDPRVEKLWSAAIKDMELALTRLDEAKKSPVPLPGALSAEQSAYQALLKLQAREYSVSRSRSQSRGQGGEQANQRQLDQLDLTQEENRYETQRQARAPQSAEQTEQLQVLNRLQELARRQEDLNERLKELQTALQEAKSEQEREEARRQLKRLQEEQRQMLADVDELRQRMERPENQSRMAEQKQQLDQTREDVQRAAEAAQEGATGQALASGTRAQRQLQELRDEMRKETSGQFGEDLKELRKDARELARQQEEVHRKLEAARQPSRRTLSDAPESKELLDQLTKQRDLMTNLVDRATQVSQLAENAEPLLAQKLYDTLRKLDQEDAGTVKQFQQDLVERGQMTRSLYERLQETADQPGGGKTLDLTTELLRQGNLAQADRAEQRARAGIDQFKQGVESAAESVLGDDAEALRRAADALDSLTQQLQKELAQAGGGQTPGEPQPGAGQREGQPPTSPGQQTPGTSPGENPGTSPGQSPGQTPGERAQQASTTPGSTPASTPGSPGQRSAENSPGQAGQTGQNGQAGQANAGNPPGSQPGQTEGNRPPGAPGNRGENNRNTARAGANLETLAGGGNDGETGGGGGPLTGGSFAPWSDQLREVEELVDQPDLRAGVAGARERARLMRLEFRRDLKKPDWAVVHLEILKPLVEVRQRIAEELARRGSKDALVPIDRDPVPTRYTELVRRYYEELGKDK